ncbi:coiled-coil domain-containing protein 190 [Echinops telfairi]|uniref:Coiled-coil domain-containing protein 190 n=2 Tax=Echinops telfairi TaxID=9371 RepID=A0AC55DQK9_ECHTE|nr:coiled-coil domain-containing protein 190 [Echinops telfairi]XP_045154032.1 coiled-coil domain-containing protein 190 [Echinops telfairi]
MERHMVQGRMHKHFDSERKTTKQAEARLGQSLQRLEALCLSHVKLLSREQRQLHKELQRLQQDIIKKKLSSYFANGSQERPEDVPQLSALEGQQHRAPRPNAFKALATKMPQEKCKATPQKPALCHTGPKDPMMNRERPLSQHDRGVCFTEEKPQAQEKDPVTPPKGRDPSLGQGQEVSTSPTGQGPGSRPADDSARAPVEEGRWPDANPEADQVPGRGIPSGPMEGVSSGNVTEMATESTYLELFAKVKNAHYLRHRVPPESERILSTGEIFGHVQSTKRV